MGRLNLTGIAKTYEESPERVQIQYYPSETVTGPDRRGDGQGATSDECYVEKRSLASADTMRSARSRS